MFDNGAEFTKENIDVYFNELSKEYKRLGGRNTPIEIILIGGAAIVENYGFRNMTTDIDAIIPPMEIVKEAINRVGDKFSLPIGWLNSDFMRTSSYSPKLTQYSKPYKTFNQVLTLRMMSGEYLIAMKLKSGRQYKNDLSDIIGILAEHEKRCQQINYSSISTAVKNLYGGWNEIDERIVTFIETVLDNGKYDEMYEAIRENERNTKSALITFEEKYPGILGINNVDSIADNVAKNNKNKLSIRETLEKMKKAQDSDNNDEIVQD